jgi:integrase
MASVWIRARKAKDGGTRYLVEYREGGRDSKVRYAGSFRTRRLATIRAGYVEGELAAKRAPDVRGERAPTVPTFAVAATRWQASRVDVAEATATQHRTALNRVLPTLGRSRVDEISPADVAGLIAALNEDGKRRETIRKSVTALAMVLDFARVTPNPARDRVIVKLPREEPEEPNPPIAAHVEAVYWALPSKHRLPLLFLDWSGARVVAAIDKTLVGDYDEPRRRVRLRAATTKTRRALWVELHPVIADAVEDTLGPREDRDPTARLFADSGADALRTAIAKACRATGIPLWSPHDLRHRRISLLHAQGNSWARVGEWVGQRDLAVTANIYTHVLVDEAEIDYAALLSHTAAT